MNDPDDFAWFLGPEAWTPLCAPDSVDHTPKPHPSILGRECCVCGASTRGSGFEIDGRDYCRHHGFLEMRQQADIFLNKKGDQQPHE